MTDEIRSAGDTRTVHLEREYRTGPTDLWEAWTQPDRLARWFGTPAGPILSAAGPVRVSMGDSDDDWVDIEIVTAEPPSFLELRWGFSGEPDSRLRLEFRPTSNGHTLLILDHQGLGDSLIGYGAGWQAFLDGPLSAELGADGRGADGRGADGRGTDAPESWEERYRQALPEWQSRAGVLSRG